MRIQKMLGLVMLLTSLVFGFQNCSKVQFGEAKVVDPGELKGTEVTKDNVDDLADELQEKHEEGQHEPPEDAELCENEEGDDGAHVFVCHFPPGNPDDKHTICIGVPAIKAHVDHNHNSSSEEYRDYLGKCETNLCEELYSGEALKYHVYTEDGRCVWSCSAGTQPDASSGECVCKPGSSETGVDEFGRRVCEPDV